jgi:hypothetical protein
LFAVVACLTISAVLIAISLVLFVLPTIHAVRAWWTTRILYCVALLCVLLTFTFYAECDSCDSRAGSVLNGLNVLILIVLIVIAFWIEVPAKPLLGLCGGGPAGMPQGTTPSAAAPVVKTTRTAEVTSEGRKIVRQVVTYPDGRHEETVTMAEEEESEQPVVTPDSMEEARPSWNEQTFCVREEMMTAEGNPRTVEMTHHTDGRQEMVETVEEPSLIGVGDGGKNGAGNGNPAAVVEINRTRAESRMPNGTIKVVEEIVYSDGTKELIESFDEPSMIGGAWSGGVGMDPPE